MRAAIGKKLVADGIVFEKNQNFGRSLHNLDGKGMKINTRKAGRSASVVNRVVCFGQRISSRSKGRLGGIVLRLSPGGHRRLFNTKFINPVALVGGKPPGMVIEPNARQIMCLVRSRSSGRFGFPRSLRNCRRTKTQNNRKRQREPE